MPPIWRINGPASALRFSSVPPYEVALLSLLSTEEVHAEVERQAAALVAHALTLDAVPASARRYGELAAESASLRQEYATLEAQLQGLEAQLSTQNLLNQKGVGKFAAGVEDQAAEVRQRLYEVRRQLAAVGPVLEQARRIAEDEITDLLRLRAQQACTIYGGHRGSQVACLLGAASVPLTAIRALDEAVHRLRAANVGAEALRLLANPAALAQPEGGGHGQAEAAPVEADEDDAAGDDDALESAPATGDPGDPSGRGRRLSTKAPGRRRPKTRRAAGEKSRAASR